MHEWSLASGLISTLQDYVKSKGGGRVVSATVRIGTLSMVDPDTMKEALGMLSKPAGLSGVNWQVKRVDTRFSCKQCGTKWAFSEVEDDLRRTMPPELSIHGETGEKDAHDHYPPEFVYAWMKCPKCGNKDYDVTDISGAALEEVVLEK